MAKSLTTEDLIYILNAALRYSLEENNALELKEDGMYVESHHVHSDQAKLHVPSENVHDIISLFTVDEFGRLMYNNKPSTILISDREGNAISIDSDNGGLYIQEIPTTVASHMNNSDIHITAFERETWNAMLNNAKQYTDTTLDQLRRVQHVELVTEMPPAQEADSHTIYLCADDNTAEEVTMRMVFDGSYVTMNITKETLRKYYTKTEADEKFLSKDDAAQTYLPNTNADILQNIVKDGDHLVPKNKKFLSSRPHNGLTCDEDGGLYYPDIENEVRSLSVCAALSKTNLLDVELASTGKHMLKDNINNYNLLLIDYYYYPNGETVIDDIPNTKGYAKTVTVDPDTMEWLYTQGIDYCLEVGWGISNINTKFYMHNDYIWVNYYNNVCIFNITGLGKKIEQNNPFEDNQQEGGDT